MGPNARARAKRRNAARSFASVRLGDRMCGRDFQVKGFKLRVKGPSQSEHDMFCWQPFIGEP